MNIKEFGKIINKGVTKFSNSIIVKSIANGMARILPVTMVGSVATLLLGLPIESYTTFLANTGFNKILQLGSTMTNDIITLYLVVCISFEMAKLYKKSQINAVCISLLAFFILTPLTVFDLGEGKSAIAMTLTFLGSKGMFIGMITALLATRSYVFFMEHGVKIKMHPSVPRAITSSFESLFPIVFVSILFLFINAMFSFTAFGNAHSFIYAILQKPLEGAGGSLATMLIICLLSEGFWWFGIHGSNVTSAITNTLYLPLAIANAQALATGLPMEHILSAYFLNVYKGPRHLALACVLVFIARSNQLKAIGKVAIVPGAFGISEPMKFGIPMVFNPALLIPMAFAPVVCITLAYFATTIGFLPIVGINLPWAMPPFISGFIAGGWQGTVIQILQFILVIALYLPFIKFLDKQKCRDEETMMEVMNEK